MRHNTAEGYIKKHKNSSRLNEDKENTAISFSEPPKKMAIRYTTTNSSRKQLYSNTQSTSNSSGSNTLVCSYNTDFLTAQTTPPSPTYIFLHWQQIHDANIKN